MLSIPAAQFSGALDSSSTRRNRFFLVAPSTALMMRVAPAKASFHSTWWRVLMPLRQTSWPVAGSTSQY